MKIFRNMDLYTFLCVLISLGISSTVIYGWHTENTALVQVSPTFAPMQYNTALGMFFSGFGLLFLALGQNTPSRLIGLCAACLGAATIAEYVFDIDLGIDLFLMDYQAITQMPYTGRMAPNTALCMTFTGLSLIMGIDRRPVMVSLSIVILVLSLLTILGYLFSEESIYGWGNLPRMSPVTAVGFLALSSGLIYHGVLGQKDKRIEIWSLMPTSVAAVVAVITILSWFSISEASKARNQDYFNTLVADTHGVLKERYNLYEQSLWGGLGLFYASESVSRAEWQAYVNALDIQKHLPGISGVGYIDYVLAQDLPAYLNTVRMDNVPDFSNYPNTFYPDKFIIKFIEPTNKNNSVLGLDIGFEANRRAAAERARDLGVPALTKKVVLAQDTKNQAGFLLLIPVYKTKLIPSTLEERRKNFQGWVYAPFIGKEFLRDLINISKHQLDFDVYDGRKVIPDNLIYQSSEKAGSDTFIKKTKTQFAGRTWTIIWKGSENFKPPASLSLAFIVLCMGSLFSIFLYFALKHLLRSKEIIAREVESRTRELADSESYQRAILHNTVDGIFTINEDGIIQNFNPAAELMFGYTASDIIGKNVGLLIPELQISGGAGIAGTTKKLHAVRKDGRSFPADISISEVVLEQGRLFSGIIRDISEPVRNQERIDLLKRLLIASAQTNSFDELLETVLRMICEYIDWPVGHAYIWDKDAGLLKPSGRWYLKNEDDTYSEFKTITEETTFKPGVGLPGRVFQNQKPLWIDDVSTDTNFPRNKYLTAINLHSGFGLPVFLGDEVRVVLEFFSPYNIPEDKELLRLWEAAGHQLSRIIERGDAEEQRVLYMHELEDAKEEALYANMMKSEFLANMSHEIRTPLNGVIGAGELLRKTNISDIQKKYLDVIIGSGDTLLSLINDILDLSKIEAGEIKISPESISVKRQITNLVAGFLPKAQSKNITIKTEFKGDVPHRIMADPIRLSQIIINLLGNAVKFVERGHIIISVEGKKVPDNLVHLKISVEDTGIGIAEDKLDIIFDKFSQADASTTKKYGGTGLGLAITRRLIDLMGGSIGVKSQLGVGSTFWFEITVPIATKASETLDADLQIEEEKTIESIINDTSITPLNAAILLVENELVNQMVATDMLQAMGCSVDLAENGQEALDILEKNGQKYDIILMDCMMPIMDGYQATQAIREREQGTGIHKLIIAMTASAMPEERVKCFDAGMDDFILKPVKEDVLYSRLKEHLSKAGGRK